MSRPTSALTRVLSIVRAADAGAARAIDPGLDLNAYAIAGELELTLVLKDRAVELALASAACHPEEVAGRAVPATVPATDLQGLLASGVSVLAVAEDMEQRGLTSGDLIAGVGVLPEARLATLIISHDVTLTISG